MAKSRKSRKLSITEKYERRRLWAGYFGIAFKEMKRATRKALKAIDKAIKQKRIAIACYLIVNGYDLNECDED